jgi:Mg2+/Co2+ transporter CorB
MILTAIFAIALMICISAVLSATETAITAASPGRLYKLKSSGDKRADIALSILKVKEKVISTMLIGNSFLNTLCTTLATGVCIELFEDPHIGTITASMIMAFLIIVFAEVIPKALAVTKAEVLIIWNSYAILFCLRLLSPVHNVLDLFIRSFCFLFNIDLTNKFSGTEEVRGVIEHHHNEGNVYKADRDMLEGILDIRDMHVSEIMVHRSKINGISIDLPTAEIVRTALSSPNTRIPIWKDSADNIVGIMHIKDLVRDLHEHKNDPIKVNIRSLLLRLGLYPRMR